MPRVPRFLRPLAGLAVAAIVFLVAGELLARSTGILDRLNGYTRSLYAPGPDADLPYVLRPGVTTRLRGVDVATNALGFRGPDVAPMPAPETSRIAVLGDSVAFGQELPQDRTLASQLEAQLEAAGLAVEVVNLGVPGYDTVSAVRLFESLGLGLGPRAVVLALSLNDHDVTPQYSPFGILVRKELERRAPELTDHSEFLTLLRWTWRWMRGELAVQMMRASEARHEGPPGAPPAFVNAPAVVASVRDQRLAFYRDPPAAYWDRMRAALAQLGRVCDAHGLALVVAIFPESYQIGTGAPDLVPQRRLADACREAGIPCLDLQPAFARAGGFLFHDVSHPNAAGHAVAAAEIAGALRPRLAPQNP